MEFNDSLSSAFSIDVLREEKMRKLGVWATYSGPHDTKRKEGMAVCIPPPNEKKAQRGANNNSEEYLCQLHREARSATPKITGTDSAFGAL